MRIKEHIKFGITLGIIPFIPVFILYKHNHYKLSIILLVLFLFTSLLCLTNEKFGLNLKSKLTKIGKFIGKYIAIVVLFIGYFIAVLPTGLLMKLVKRDRLKLKKQNVNSYWVNYDKTTTDYEYQF